MALAAANSPRNQARMASLANESETSIGGGTIGAAEEEGSGWVGVGVAAAMGITENKVKV